MSCSFWGYQEKERERREKAGGERKEKANEISPVKTAGLWNAVYHYVLVTVYVWQTVYCLTF